MKLAVFAHTPPPDHGQSRMVALLLEKLGGDARRGRVSKMRRIECFHINARFSDDINEIGRSTWSKPLRLVRYCLEALWCRFWHGANVLYYVPAPDLRVAVWRDLAVMACCRLFFRRLVYHHHASGLARWLREEAGFLTRTAAQTLLLKPDLSIVLGEFNRSEAVALKARRIEVVPNGVDDLCRDFSERVEADRRRRREQRRLVLSSPAMPLLKSKQPGPATPVQFRMLFLGLCCREKGLFDALDAAAALAPSLREAGVALDMRLDVAGKFWRDSEQKEFETRIQREDLNPAGVPLVAYRGFVGGNEKLRLLREADLLVFPTYYWAETFGLVLIEAMSHGLPCLTTRWKGIPELFETNYPGLVDPQSPSQLSEGIRRMLLYDDFAGLRRRFLERYHVDRWVEAMEHALSVE